MIMIQQGASPITTNMLRMWEGAIHRGNIVELKSWVVSNYAGVIQNKSVQVGASRYSAFVSGFIFLFGQQQSAQFRFLFPPFHPTFGGNDGILLPVLLAVV